MRKLIAIFIITVLLLFNTGSIFAANGDYKNNLLKIEITKLDENHYDIGLFTQKIYNEPVKVIKKSDTVYYLLLPETGHSITSVPPLGAIKSVVVKSYPYAGQDLDNSYTKIGIITSKAINLSATLKTADPSISPRLDPLRLAKLDQVFERYSERLAQNNIPTPLTEFRKKAAMSKQEAFENSLASGDIQEAESFEDYQNRVNREQAEKKSEAAVQKTVTNIKKQQPITQIKTPSKPQQKTVNTQRKNAPVTNAVKKQQTKPVSQKVANKPKPLYQQNKTTLANSEAPIVLKPVSRPVNKPSVQNQPKETPKVVQKETSTQASLDMPKTVEKQAIATTKSDVETNRQIEEAREYEKQLTGSTPVNVEFGIPVPVDTTEVKDIQAEVIQPDVNTEPTHEIPSSKDNNNLVILVGVFCLFLFAYIMAKIAKAKKRAAYERAVLQNEAEESFSNTLKEYKKKPVVEPVDIPSNQGFKETYQQQIPQPASKETIQPVRMVQEPVRPVEILNPMLQEDNEEHYEEQRNDYMPSQNVPQRGRLSEVDEKVQAFNAYMDSVSKTPEYIMNSAEDDSIMQTEDDELLRQLYTPVETDLVAKYGEDKKDLQDTSSNNDVATIVSSSKLTETRGLYLAKFEGTTSLVGYIQDDIYVLYNFGDMEVKETGIESRLAQENETDSLYIVRTGGKKLMVKSTPYDLSLEMVM